MKSVAIHIVFFCVLVNGSSLVQGAPNGQRFYVSLDYSDQFFYLTNSIAISKGHGLNREFDPKWFFSIVVARYQGPPELAKLSGNTVTKHLVRNPTHIKQTTDGRLIGWYNRLDKKKLEVVSTPFEVDLKTAMLREGNVLAKKVPATSELESVHLFYDRNLFEYLRQSKRPGR